MHHAACQLCAAANGDQAYACTACARGLAAALTDIPHLAEELDTATARLAVLGPGSSRAVGAAPPLPIDPDASETAHVLRSTLATWIRAVHDDVGGTLPADTMPAMARWMGAYAMWLRHAPYAAELIDEITAAAEAARRRIDRPARRIPLDRACRAVVLDGLTPRPCPGRLYAVLDCDHAAGDDMQVRCTSGQREHTTTVAAMADRRRGARLSVPRTA